MSTRKQKNSTYSGSCSSSDGTKLSLDYLTHIAKKFKTQNRQPSTKHTYKQAWYNFNDFLICMDKMPDSWNDRICLFVPQLIVEKHPPPIIQSYVSAVKAILREEGVEIEDNSVALAALIHSAKHVN